MNEPKETSKGYYSIATKAKAQTYKALKRLCKKRGVTTYEMLQNVIDTLVRYMDCQHNLSEEIEQAVSIFEHCIGWRDALNLADPDVELEISEAIYFAIGRQKQADGKGKPKKGARAIWVQRPFMGNWTQNVNVQEILERCVCVMFPELYRQMRSVAVDIDSHSVLETIKKLIATQIKESDLKALREDFEDASRSEWGEQPHEGGPYRRKMHKDIDSLFPDEDGTR